MRLIFVLLIMFASFIGTVAQAQTLLRGTDPGWIEGAVLPEADPRLAGKTQSGVLYLLSDDQVSWQGQNAIWYRRLQMKVIDRTGLETAATIRRDFDPEFDKLTLTRLFVIRGDQKIDLIGTVKDDVFRREDNLDSGILDGRLTAVLQIPDLRVGDVVDFAFLQETEPLIEGMGRSGFVPMEYDVPVVLSRLIVHWPKDWQMNLGSWPDRVSYKKAGEGDTTRHEWQRLNHIPPKEEENAPITADPTAIIRFSAFPDWGALSAAMTPHYAKDYPLSPGWEERLETIRQDHSSDADRTYAALRLVQDEIRYVSLSIGVGGIIARDPQTVISSGFGDCKDKSLLLRTLLRRMGIAADVALTDIDQGYALPLDQPRLGAFDHAIVRAELDGRAVWMDPTGVHEGGGPDTAVTPDYGYALPLRGAAQRELEPIILSDQTLWDVEANEEFRFTPEGVQLNVTTVHRGVAANHYRYRFATESRDAISEEFLKYYAGRYPGIETARDIRMSDRRGANRLETVESYFIPAAALAENDLGKDFPFGAGNFVSDLSTVLTGKRTLPFYAGGRSKIRHKVRILDAPISFRAPDPVAIGNSAFRFSFVGKAEADGELRLIYRFDRSGSIVPPEEVAGVLRDADRIGQNIVYSWDLTPSDSSDNKRP